MEIDHTKAVEKRMEIIRISLTDSCSFFEPKEGSLLIVNLCAYCKHSKFEEKALNGLCRNHLEHREKLHGK